MGMAYVPRLCLGTIDEAQYDLQVKKLLGNKEVVAYILSKTVDEFKGMELEKVRKCVEDVYIDKVPVDPGLTNKKITTETGDRLIALDTEDGEQNESFIRYDIISYVRTRNGLSKYIVNLEPQKSEPEDYYSVCIQRKVHHISLTG